MIVNDDHVCVCVCGICGCVSSVCGTLDVKTDLPLGPWPQKNFLPVEHEALGEKLAGSCQVWNG